MISFRSASSSLSFAFVFSMFWSIFKTPPSSSAGVTSTTCVMGVFVVVACFVYSRNSFMNSSSLIRPSILRLCSWFWFLK